MLEVIDCFCRTNGIEVPYDTAPRRAGDLPSYHADVTKADQLLRWKAELIDYLDYYNNHRAKEKFEGLPPAIHRQQALMVA